MKNKFITVILAFFLGGFGIHRFYLGETKKGLLYLFFCWTLIPTFFAFCDTIIFLFMSNHQFNLRYNNTF
ncbi:TPA: TM2 domain-containing protein [Elizabethkingia anophelis]